MKFLSNYSNRELNIWGELVLNILVSLYYFPAVFLLEPGSNEYVEEFAWIVLKIVIFAVTYSIIVFSTISILTKEEKKDERDREFDIRGAWAGYNVLDISVAVVLVLIIVGEMAGDTSSISVIQMSPIFIAQLLMLVLVVSSMVKSLAKLYYYRKTI